MVDKDISKANITGINQVGTTPEVIKPIQTAIGNLFGTFFDQLSQTEPKKFLDIGAEFKKVNEEINKFNKLTESPRGNNFNSIG